MANEKRLIDAYAFRRRIEAFVATARYKGINNVPTGHESCNPTEYMRGYERGIMDTYTVAVEQPQVDAVEVVRCKDCKYYRPQKISANWEHKKSFCNRVVTVKMPPDGFCSYGERRECNG
jgi:hypothetical protein